MTNPQTPTAAHAEINPNEDIERFLVRLYDAWFGEPFDQDIQKDIRRRYLELRKSYDREQSERTAYVLGAVPIVREFLEKQAALVAALAPQPQRQRVRARSR
jgi:hypothetical protein